MAVKNIMTLKKYLPLLFSTIFIYGGISTSFLPEALTNTSSALTIAQNNVNGRNVTEVKYGNSGGFFRQQSDGSWIEKNADGQFTFKETGRDDGSVYLTKSDGLKIQLDLRNKAVIWVGKGKLYTITSFSSSNVATTTNRPAEKIQFSILNYNAMLLDSTTFPNHKQKFRAGAIPKAIQKNGTWDVIVINEAFLNSARQTLQGGLLLIGYPFLTKVVDKSGNLDDGGVFIQSRLPILATDMLVFNDCSGSDCLSNKGVMYAKVQKNSRIIHIFGTHLQSSRGRKEAQVRTKQLRQLNSFIKSKAPNAKAKNEIIIVSGDLNFDPKLDGNEYVNALSTLNASLYGNRPSGYTFDPKNNSVAKYRYKGEKQEWLDYIFVGKNGAMPSNVSYSVMKFKNSTTYNMPAVGDPLGVFDKGTNHRDLSDHYGLSAKFNF